MQATQWEEDRAVCHSCKNRTLRLQFTWAQNWKIFTQFDESELKPQFFYGHLPMVAFSRVTHHVTTLHHFSISQRRSQFSRAPWGCGGMDMCDAVTLTKI